MSKAIGNYSSPSYKLEWQNIAKDTDRLMVDGGYLYRTVCGSYSAPAMVFVRDPPRDLRCEACKSED